MSFKMMAFGPSTKLCEWMDPLRKDGIRRDPTGFDGIRRVPTDGLRRVLTDGLRRAPTGLTGSDGVRWVRRWGPRSLSRIKVGLHSESTRVERTLAPPPQSLRLRRRRALRKVRHSPRYATRHGPHPAPRVRAYLPLGLALDVLYGKRDRASR